MRRGWWLPGLSERRTRRSSDRDSSQQGPDVAAGEVGAAAGVSGEVVAATTTTAATVTTTTRNILSSSSSDAFEGLARRLQGFAPTTAHEAPSCHETERNLTRVSREFAARQRAAVAQARQTQVLSFSETSLTDATEFCRICRDSAGREALISPCDCRGTVRFVHKSCLERWLAESDTSFCEICGLRYVTERTPRYSLLKSMFLWAMASRRELLLDVMTLLTFMPLAVLGTSMGMTASRSLCYGLLSEPNDDGVSNLVLLVEPQLGPVAAQVCSGLACSGAQTLTAAVVAVMAAMDIAVSTWLVLRVQQHASRCYAWWRRHCVVHLILPPAPTPEATEDDATHVNAEDDAPVATTTASTTITTVGERALPASEVRDAVRPRRESTREAPDPESLSQKSIEVSVSVVSAKVANAISEGARVQTLSDSPEEVMIVAAVSAMSTAATNAVVGSSNPRIEGSEVRDVVSHRASSRLFIPRLQTSPSFHSSPCVDAAQLHSGPQVSVSTYSVASSIRMPPVTCASEPCSGVCTAECAGCRPESRPATCGSTRSILSAVSHPSILYDSSDDSNPSGKDDSVVSFGVVASHIFSNSLTNKPGTMAIATAKPNVKRRPRKTSKRRSRENANTSRGAIPKVNANANANAHHSEGGRSSRATNGNGATRSSGSGSSTVSTGTTIIRIHIPNAKPPSQRQRPRSPGL